MFRILLDSYRLAEPVLAADRAAAAGREYYDDGFFAAFKPDAFPIVDQRDRRRHRRLGGVHHRRLGAGRQAGGAQPALAVAASHPQAAAPPGR